MLVAVGNLVLYFFDHSFTVLLHAHFATGEVTQEQMQTITSTLQCSLKVLGQLCTRTSDLVRGQKGNMSSQLVSL